MNKDPKKKKEYFPYLGLGITLCTGLGAIFGVLFGVISGEITKGVAFGTALGTGFGVTIGAVIEAIRRRQSSKDY